jgi:hypothetical protein
MRGCAERRRVGPARLCERRPTLLRPVRKTPSRGSFETNEMDATCASARELPKNWSWFVSGCATAERPSLSGASPDRETVVQSKRTLRSRSVSAVAPPAMMRMSRFSHEGVSLPGKNPLLPQASSRNRTGSPPSCLRPCRPWHSPNMVRTRVESRSRTRSGFALRRESELASSFGHWAERYFDSPRAFLSRSCNIPTSSSTPDCNNRVPGSSG